MNLKDKLIKLKKDLFDSILPNRDYEFEATLEDHPIGNQNIYRLYYVNFHRIGEDFRFPGLNNIGVIDWPCKPFMLPNGMTREEGFKVLSYLTDFIEKRKEIEPCSLESVRILDGVLDLERFGFTRINTQLPTDSADVINLFTVSGRILLFKKSELYSKYFEWYTKGVTLEEVENIYNKYNMEFQDIKWSDEPKEEKIARVLKRN